MRLIDDGRRVIKRAWSIRVALLWRTVAGLYAAWPALQEILPAWALAGAASAVVLGSTALIQPWEGRRL